jgi:hypothetical protein
MRSLISTNTPHITATALTGNPSAYPAFESMPRRIVDLSTRARVPVLE